MTGLVQERRGVVTMEFLLALGPVMLTFLAVAQYSFLSVASLLVRHSASAAVRAAVVVIEESDALPGVDPGIYGGALAGSVDDPGTRAAETPVAQLRNSRERGRLLAAARHLNAGHPVLEQLQTLAGGRDESRIAQIRTAAYLPMLTVSPDARGTLGFLVDAGPRDESATVQRAIGTAGPGRALGAFLYNLGMLSVTFPSQPGGVAFKHGGFERGALVTARVSYLFRCQVPLASLLICDSGLALRTGQALLDRAALWFDVGALGGDLPRSEGELGGWSDRLSRMDEKLDRHRQRVAAFSGHKYEFDRVEVPGIQELLLMTRGARYFALRAEASLPLQSAEYYPRERD